MFTIKPPRILSTILFLLCLSLFALVALDSPAKAQTSFPEGYYLDFDNSNDVVTLTSESLPTQMTIESWINPRSTGNRMIFSVIDLTDNYPNVQFRLRNSSALSLLAIFDDSGVAVGNWQTPNNAVQLSTWQHVAVTYDASSAANDPVLYVNGVPQTVIEASTPSGNIRSDIGNWTIGNHSGQTAPFNGEIDEVRVWNKVLSQAEIQANINQQLTGSEPGLIGYWRLNDGTGQTVTDSSPFARNGVLGSTISIESSDPVWVQVSTSDTTPPSISVTSPVAGAIVNGLLPLTAIASDNVAVAHVQFQVDGVDYGSMDVSDPYEITVDTGNLTVGLHTFSAVATDTSGNQQTSSVAVIMDNNSKAHGFFDHFLGNTLEPRWTSVTSASGSAQITDSFLECNAPQATDYCAVYYKQKIDRNRSQLLVFAFSNHSNTFPQNWLTLVNSATPPTADTFSNLYPSQRIRVHADIIGASQGIVFEHWDANHNSITWDQSTNSWSPATNLANSPIVADDYYLVGLETDGANGRFRLMAWAKASSGGYTFDQGLRLFTLTDWVSWSSVESSNNLWLVIGDPYTDSHYGTLRTEWARLDTGTREDAWLNGKGASSDHYTIQHVWGYQTPTGTVDVLVPEDRGTPVLTGSAGQWDSGTVKDPFVFFDPDDHTFYLLYAGSGPSGFQIGVAENKTPYGAFTKVPQNPIIPASPNGGIFAPSLVKDLAEPDPNKRFKNLYTGFDLATSDFRIFLATAPAITGPWTEEGLVVDVGAPGAFDQNGYSRARPVFENGQWHVFLSAKNNDQMGGPFRVSYATGPTLDNLTPTGQVLVESTGIYQDITSNVSGRIVKVADTTGFIPDGFLFIDQDNNAENYGQSRIRKIIDSTSLELYHSLNGFTTATPAKIVQIDGSNRIEISDIRRTDTGWSMYVTPFSLFGAVPNTVAYDENTGVLSSLNLTGPFIWDHLASPPATRGSWNNKISFENTTFVHFPVNTSVTPTPTPSPLPTSTPTPTSSPTHTPTSASSNTPTATPSPISSPTSPPSPTPTPTVTLTPTLSPSSTPTNTATHTPSPTSTSTETPLPTDTATPTSTATPLPTSTPSSSPSPTPSPANTALNFDGSDDYVVTNASFRPPNHFSLSTWINPSSMGERNAGHILGIRDDADNNPNIQLRFIPGNRLRFLVVFNDQGKTSVGYWDTPSNSISFNSAQHIAVTYDSSSAANDPRIYIDGVLQVNDRDNNPNGIINNESTLWIIGNSPNQKATFQGIIDEMRVYDRILSAIEVLSHYNSGQIVPGQPEPGLLAGWHFDEGSGSTAFDYSGNGRHATLVNGPQWVNY